MKETLLLPARRLLLAAGAWLLVGAAAVVWPALDIAWPIAGAALLAVAVADALSVFRARHGVSARRDLARTLPAGVWQRVALTLRSPMHAVSGVVVDHHPPLAEAEEGRQPFHVAPGRSVEIGYRLRMLERGEHRFGPIEVQLDSPVGLWRLRLHLGEPLGVRVYPDFARVTHYALLATENRLSQIGVLRRRRRGEGLEFHQLRDYRQDDSPRRIDWKASSRHRRLISREYQDERDQQIVFLLDCGHRMRSKDEALSHFDHALNALLLLAYVALRQGDAVGLATFAHPSPLFIAPRKSIATVPALLNAVYDLQPTLHTADYLQAAEGIIRRIRRRALIVLATTTRGEDGDALGRAANLLQRRHALVVASLREAVLEQARQAPIRQFEDALLYAAASEYATERERHLALLRRSGVSIVDVEPRALPARLVNQYWQIKRAGAI